MAAPAMGMATGLAKLKAVTELVDRLSEDADLVTMVPDDRNEALEELKLYGRDPQDADPIYTKKGMSALLRHAFRSPSSKTARAALRVLANAMLLKAETRQIFVDDGFAPGACTDLRTDDWDTEFLTSRIIFLSTYGTDIDLEVMIDKHHLADNIVHNLQRHAKLSSRSKAKADPLEGKALLETLKLLFNVTHFCTDRVSSFTPSIPHVVALFWRQDIPDTKPLESVFGPLTNALLNLDIADDKARAILFPKSEPRKLSSRLIDLLELSMRSYNEEELETIVTPVVSLLKKVYEHSPPEAQEHMRERLLPSAQDRKSILGQGDSLSAILLRNSTNPTAPSLREAISHLFFDLSDQDASKFVENVGYGFASGFLFQNNVPIPASASEAFSTGDIKGQQRHVDPTTGQFLGKRSSKDELEMSQEEKEREAERLFVLFERLKANGVIDVQNPVEAAVQEGRFSELGGDEVEESND